MELVSIIIPAYNAERYVREAVESALAQVDANVEVIVVDDGSTDGTAQVVAQFGTQIRLIRQDNAGVAAACNAGVRASAGRWIAFLDADDVWLPEKTARQLERCSSFAISHTDSMCFGEHLPQDIRRSSFEPPYSGRVLQQLLVRNFITKSSVMMDRELYVSAGGFGEHFAGVEDWPFWLQICAEHELGYLDLPVVRYRVHRASKSMQARKTMADHRRVIEQAFSPEGVGASYPDLKKVALASSYEINAHYAAESGDWLFAARCALGSAWLRPTTVYSWKMLLKSILIPLGVKY